MLVFVSILTVAKAQVQFQNTNVGTATSSAIGESSVANGDFSFAGGEQCNSLGMYAFSYGYLSDANGKYSTIFGSNNRANGNYSYIFGEDIKSDFDYSFNFGKTLVNNADYSFMLGFNSTNNSRNTFSFGNNLENSGDGSFLFGNFLNSSANNNFTFGYGIGGNSLNNNQSNTMMFGINSNLPTLYIGASNGANTTGNIGIATTSPGSKLQINGNTAIGYNTNTIAPTNGLAVAGKLGVGTNTPNTNLQVVGNAAFGTFNSAPSNSLVVSGNIGIGNNNPNTRLQVVGNAAFGSYTSAPSNGLVVSGNTGIGTNNPYAKLTVVGNAAIGYNSTAIVSNTPTDGLIVNGNVGIGTLPSISKMEIKQTINEPALVLDINNVNYNSYILFSTNTALPHNPTVQHNFYDIAELKTGNTSATNGLPKTLNFDMKHNTSLFIADGGLAVGFVDKPTYTSTWQIPNKGLIVKGSTGIGIEPTKKLTVDGDMLAYGGLLLRYSGNDFVIDRGGSIGQYGIDYYYRPYLINDPKYHEEYNFYKIAKGDFNFLKKGEGASYLFTITTDGDVGINQKEPKATLHIVEESYNIKDPKKCKDAIRIDGGSIAKNDNHPHFVVKSNGYVYAREINVQLGNLPTPFPDYVFADDYQLPKLADIEQYVKLNKHLPEVPTAQQMADDGVNLGEMNITLLKKVEELTLHIIELNKRLEKLEKENVSN